MAAGPSLYPCGAAAAGRTSLRWQLGLPDHRLFSVTSRYGTPAQFAGFVNACHRMGIGVIMDFVPVHFAANADALAKFDGTYLYEYDSDVGHSEWGTCNFNYYRREVCSFLNSAAALWMDVYHCDGIRMDAISRALYWQGDPNRGVNEGAVNFLRSLNHGLNERWPTGIYMAEDSTNFLKVTAPHPLRRRGLRLQVGYGLDA